MTFYTGLRDNTAGPLIAQFGQSATYRVYGAETYDNDTGKTTKGSPTTVSIKLLDLPISDREFTEDVVAESKAMFLVAADALAAASVVPVVDAEILLGSDVFRILKINPIGPAGVPVIFKMAVA
ncbi:tail attachment protein [Pseudanabaena phage Pan1]|nr:tail attachment protein [Pseudanabaena phage Pan1]